MEPYIRISDIKIDQKFLHFILDGRLTNCESEDKVRVVLVFHQEHENRRIPVNISYEFTKQETLTCKYHGSVKIHLPSVFYRKMGFSACTMSVLLAFGYEEWTEAVFDTEGEHTEQGITVETNYLTLKGSLFTDHIQSKNESYHTKPNAFLFACCILLFPYFLISGLKRNKGLKSVLRYISNKTGEISGISYSKREWKTNYFRDCYIRMHKAPVINNRVVFLSERKLDKNGNLYRVMERLKSRQGVEILLLQKEKTVSDLSLSELKHIARTIATARIIVLDDFYPQLHALDIRKDTSVIQLWHATGAFKTFGFSRLGKPGGAPEQSRNHRSYDYAFVSGERIRGIYSEAFGIPIENVQALGVPRTDDFFSHQYRQSMQHILYQKYPQLKDKKVVLIAPTFRGDGNRDAYYPVNQLSIDQLCEQIPEEYVFVIKMHPFVKDRFLYDSRYKNRVLDLTQDESINDLLFVTDLLVTDYSSVVFEAALLKIPMVFYAYDMDEYMKDRDIYYDYKHFVPGPIVYNQEQLCNSLLQAGEDQEKVQFMKDFFLDALDGNSTQRIADFIYDLL